MTQNGSRDHAWKGAAHKMQVRTANRGGRDSDNCVRGLLNLRRGYVIEADITNPVINNCFHTGSLFGCEIAWTSAKESGVPIASAPWPCVGLMADVMGTDSIRMSFAAKRVSVATSR